MNDRPPGDPVRSAERGSVTIADRAVRRIVQQAAVEVLAGAGTVREASVVRLGRQKARVGVELELAYPADLVEQGERVQRHVADRATALSGLDVTRADVAIGGFSAAPALVVRARTAGDDPGGHGPSANSGDSHEGGKPLRARRPWSSRRLPAASVALAVATAAGVALAGIARDGLTRPEPLRDVPLTDARWIAAGAAVALFGAVLVVLAVTPGLRRRLPMAPPEAHTRATIDRSAVGLLLRDAVMTVDGVSGVRVRAGRRRVRVRVLVGYGATDGVRRAAESSAAVAARGLGLARMPRLSVKAVPDKRWSPPADKEVAS
ncbi:DUF6286 domain-containing protein [Streptomyces sp. NPDC055749]